MAWWIFCGYDLYLIYSIAIMIITLNCFNNHYKSFLGGLTLGSFLIMIGLWFLDGFVNPTREAYKIGQINALCGHVEYHRVILPDSSIIWERIDDKVE